MKKNFKDLNIAIVGASGAVGKELLPLLAKQGVLKEKISCFASPRSLGKTIPYQESFLEMRALSENSFEGIDLAFFSAGSAISKIYAPIAKQSGALVIDNTSAFRMDPKVPLIIPEINPHAARAREGIISSPNCAATIMLVALFPLHKAFNIQKIVVATYQAASGAGQLAMQELQEETKAFLENTSYKRSVMPHPYAFNLFTHNSALSENGYVDEELKIIHESHKILETKAIKICPTCVRVPVLRSHAMAIYVEFEKDVTARQARDLLQKAEGVKLLEDFDKHHFPMPSVATNQEMIFCGRIREDLFDSKALHLWAVGDQLLKGASWNMLQIALLVMQHDQLIQEAQEVL